MTRDNPFLLPMCQECGKYKGVGPCVDSNCPGSKITSTGNDSGERMEGPTYESCSLCRNETVVSCCRCSRGFCKKHETGKVEGRLVKWDQRVGTCTICKQVVCENCWILEGDGTITCLVHHEGGSRHHE